MGVYGPLLLAPPEYSTVQYITVQYSTVQYSTVQYSTVQYSTVQYSTVQYSTVQYSTVQYSTGGWLTPYSTLCGASVTGAASLVAECGTNILFKKMPKNHFFKTPFWGTTKNQ